jgi:hypothetical protein
VDAPIADIRGRADCDGDVPIPRLHPLAQRISATVTRTGGRVLTFRGPCAEARSITQPATLTLAGMDFDATEHRS